WMETLWSIKTGRPEHDLNCNEVELTAEDLEQLKKCYRQKANEFHPDKITSKGLPKEFSDFANDQLSRINSAYELIKSSLEQK
ncbi:MAG: hypothetical protein EBY43_09310, partial [Opitutae bacterium]|nr:hypothetical protein [Opitutae bacterium]